MALAALSEEQTDLLLNIREDQVEVELNSAVSNHNNNNCNKNNFSGKGGKFKSRALLCSREFARLFPSRHRCFLHVTSIFHIFLAVALLVTIPKYGQISSGIGGDNFSSLFFVMAITTTILILLMGLRKFWDSTFSLYSKVAIRSILRDSLLFTISTLGLSFCCEPDRVPCHLQDGMFFLCIPFSIVYMSIKKKRGMHLSFYMCRSYFYLFIYFACRKSKQSYKIDRDAHSFHGSSIHCYCPHVGLQVVIIDCKYLC